MHWCRGVWPYRAFSGLTKYQLPTCFFVTMLGYSAATLTKCGSNRLTQTRPLFLSTLFAAVSSLAFSENNRLASQMERGELHYEDATVPLVQQKPKPGDNKYFSRREPEYPGQVPLYTVEKLMMFLGSGLGSYFHPENNTNIVALGESTAIKPVLRRLQKQMLSDKVGRQILRERPRMTSTSLDLDHLRGLSKNSLGYTYVSWLDREGVSPDTRVPVRYIDDEELAYIYQRYRECHDFYHAITGLPIIIEGEIAVKVLEFMNMGIIMPGLGALLAPLRLKPSQRERLYSIYYPWAFRSGLNSKPLINVYWENVLEQDVGELRRSLGIEQPPDLRNLRKNFYAKLKKHQRI